MTAPRAGRWAAARSGLDSISSCLAINHLDEQLERPPPASATTGGAHEPRPPRPNPGLGTWPARRARISPDRTALLDPPRSLTYAELADRTARYAGALRRLGVGPGDRVAYLGVNAVEVFETFFATWLLGAIAVPLNYRLSGPEIRYMLDDSGASVLVHSADADALVAAAAPLPDGLRGAGGAAGELPGRTGSDYEAEIAAGPALDAEPPVRSTTPR